MVVAFLLARLVEREAAKTIKNHCLPFPSKYRSLSVHFKFIDLLLDLFSV